MVGQIWGKLRMNKRHCTLLDAVSLYYDAFQVVCLLILLSCRRHEERPSEPLSQRDIPSFLALEENQQYAKMTRM